MDKFLEENEKLINEELTRILFKYNPDFDIPQNQPEVTWVEMRLCKVINMLLVRIHNLEMEIDTMKNRQNDRPDYEY
jgi:hypothetical protein